MSAWRSRLPGGLRAALLAALALALMPALSRTIAFVQGEPTAWGVVCSASGRHQAPLPLAGAGDACALCTLSAGDAPLPAAAARAAPGPLVVHTMPTPRACPVVADERWSRAHPRAPPAA